MSFLHEKAVGPHIESEPHESSSDVAYESECDWSEAEEKALVRKLDFFVVMPFLMLSFFALQLDRGNIGNALTDKFFKEVGITQFQFNVGQQLLSAGIVILEVPSNLVLYRVGPSIWIGSQIIAWGFVATFQAFQKGHGLGPFLATRLLLGLCEAGFIPAGLYTITRWYKRDETSKRFSFFFFGNMLAAAATGLIAYGILHMRGICGLSGWQWLFLLEGIFTVLVGIIFLTLFPRSVNNPTSLLGFSYFSQREAYILSRRVILDDPSKAHAKSHVTKAELKRVFTNWRLIPHILLTIGCLAPSSVLMSYAPTLATSMGYDRLKANAMVSIGAWVLLVTNVTWGFVSDKIGRRGPMVSFGILIFWGFVLGTRLLIYSEDKHKRFALLTLAIAFASNWHPVNGSWMALNAQTAGERSITMAIFIMSANCSGIVGSQIFQAKDAPLYHTGWTVILAIVSAAFAISLIANAQYYLLNLRLRRAGRPALYKP